MKQILSKGASSVPMMGAISVIFVWCAGLSTGLYNVNGTTSGLTASVSDIKDVLDKADLPAMKAEVDFLATQRGYHPQSSEATTSSMVTNSTLTGY